MKHYVTETKNVEVKKLEAIQCDKCKKEFFVTLTDERDFGGIMDIQEFTHIDFVGGYESIFGDGNRVQADICQTCLKELLGDLLRIEDNEN